MSLPEKTLRGRRQRRAKWAQLKADAAAKMSDVQARIDKRTRQVAAMLDAIHAHAHKLANAAARRRRGPAGRAGAGPSWRGES